MPGKKVFLIYGNLEDKVSNKRFDLIHEILPQGEEDGEVVDLRPPGNMPYTLDRAFNEIVQEMATASLIPDARRVVVVYELADLRTKQKGSVRDARKASAGKKDYATALIQFLNGVLPQTENVLIFVHNDDDEKYRRVEKTSPLYQYIEKVGTVFQFNEARLDWQLEDALLAGNFNLSIGLARDWMDRGGGSSYRMVTTLNGFLQLLLQARIENEARREGRRSEGLFTTEMRPSILSIPSFKAGKYRQLAPRIPLPRIRNALSRLNNIQKSFFPTGDELVVHDPGEQIEVMFVELFANRD